MHDIVRFLLRCMTPMVHYYEFYGAGLGRERPATHYIYRETVISPEKWNKGAL